MKFKPKGAINLTILVIHAQHGQYTMIKVRRNLNFSQPTKHKHVDLFHIHAQNWCLVIDEHGIPNERKANNTPSLLGNFLLTFYAATL